MKFSSFLSAGFTDKLRRSKKECPLLKITAFSFHCKYEFKFRNLKAEPCGEILGKHGSEKLHCFRKIFSLETAGAPSSLWNLHTPLCQ